VLDRLFKLSSIGRSVGRVTSLGDVVKENFYGKSFLDRIASQRSTDTVDTVEHNSQPVGPDVRNRQDSSKRRLVSDEDEDEASIYKDSDPERPVEQTMKSRQRKRRRFDVDESDDNDSDGSVYKETDHDDSDLENQSVPSDFPEFEAPTSDVDELSISIENPRTALRGIPINRNPNRSYRTSTNSLSKHLLRESSPILLDDASDDELAI
jgi:hypothetical protein